MAPKAAPKVKKAMDKPPAAATRSHDAYPGEHLGLRPSSSRKRASKASNDDRSDFETEATDSKTKNSKKRKASTVSERTKPSKVDGHPVETVKTYPGGDMVEVEPEEAVKLSESKPADKAKDDVRHKKPGEGAVKEPAAQDEKRQGAGRKATVSSKSKEGKKGATKRNSAAALAKSNPKPNVAKTKKVESKGEPTHVESEGSALPAPKPKRKPTRSKEGTGGAGQDDDYAKAHQTQEAVSEEEAPKDGQTNPPAYGSNTGTPVADISPELAMDEGVFDSLVTSDKGKQARTEDQAPRGKVKNSKAARHQVQGGQSSKADAKKPKKSGGPNKASIDKEASASTSKSKKRKSSGSGLVDEVKADILDPLSEASSSKKKQKTSRTSALDVAGDSLGSLISGVKTSAKAAIDFAGSVAVGGQTSVMGDVAAVAEDVVREKARKKGPKAPKEPIPSEESLLKGMESSGDERDPDEDEGFEKDQLPPSIPESTFDKINALPTEDAEHDRGEGVIYVGRIPHGFYEHEMRAYFSQFGHINRLRLSRNKTTGASRHFAFVEFDPKEVANIVAETMDNYLLFGHILKVKSLDPKLIDPKIWKGANRRFKKVPWAQIEGRKLAMPMSREQWEKRIEGEEKRRSQKAEKMKEIGYEFEGPLKGVDQVPVSKATKAIEEGNGKAAIEEQTLVTEPGEEGSSMMIYESTVTKKTRKPSAKAKEIKDSREVVAATGKKSKRKAAGNLEKAKERSDMSEPVSKKLKRAKAKADEASVEIDEAVTRTAAPIVEQVGDAVENGTRKAKRKAKATAEDVAPPSTNQAKETSAEAVNEPKNSAVTAVDGGEEPAGQMSKATATASRTSKKGKTTKA